MATYVPLLPIPAQLQDVSGNNLSGGSLEFYLSGTTTPTNLFSDNAGTSIGSSITLNASGYPESGGNVITLFREAATAIKIVAKAASGATLWTADTIDGTLVALSSNVAGKGASLVGIEDSGGFFISLNVEGALAELANDKLENVSEDLTPTLGGPLDGNDEEVSQVELKDISYTNNTVAISSGAVTFDLSTGNSFNVSLTENITSITISNPSASGNKCILEIEFTQDGTGSRTVTGWPASVKWAGGSAPTITTTPTTGSDDIVLRTRDGGTSWRGAYLQDYS